MGVPVSRLKLTITSLKQITDNEENNKMSNDIYINQLLVDDPEFQVKPTWAKAIWFHLWCKCDYAGFADINWRVILSSCNVDEQKTEEEIWEALRGLVVKVEGTTLGYLENYVATARAQKGTITTAPVHLKIYKDMKARKERFKVENPLYYVRRYNPFLKFKGLANNQKNEEDNDDLKVTPKHLFEALGIDKCGLDSWNNSNQKSPASVTVHEDNKSLKVNSYTDQNDEIEDIFEPVKEEKLYPDKHPDQSKPIHPSYCQVVHDGYLSEGQYMTTDGEYRYPVNSSSKTESKEVTNDVEITANF